jgi:hypothetical protein
MRLILAALLGLWLTSAAIAADWQYEEGSIPIAYVDNGAAQFQFACRGGDLAMGFWVRAPQRAVAEAKSLHISISPDPQGAGLAAGASYAQDMPLIHADGSSVIVRGPVARQWAKIAQKARTALRIAYVRKTEKLEIFDANDFSATGSAAAIKHVLDRCGP